MSALLDRPKQITVIDEFARYLEASTNTSNHHQREANTKIMESFGRCGGIVRPQQYSTMTLKKEAADTIKDRKIYNPALTLLAITTPDKLYKSLGLESVKDGFINRFIISISEAERDVRNHKEMLDVPERIVNWIKTVANRNPVMHNSAEEAIPIVITFTSEAKAMELEFQKYCIKAANSLDKYNMAELTGRSNEVAMRVGLIHALSRNPNTDTIEKEDMEWAIGYVKTCLEKTMSVMKMNISSSPFEAHKKEVLAALRERSPEFIRLSDMRKQNPFSQHQKKYLQEILDALVESDLADERPSTGVGKPTKEYVAIA
jgi:hypothetical protein